MKEEARQWLDQLTASLKNREDQYRGALLSYSLVHEDKDRFISKLEILFGDQGFLKSHRESKKEYKNCSLIREKASLDVAKNHLKNLYGKGHICLADRDIEIEPFDMHREDLNSSRSPLGLGWSCEFFWSNASQQGRTHVSGPLLSLEEPIYPSLAHAENDWLVFTRADEYRYSLQTPIGIVFPSFKARLRSLVIGSGQFEVDVETRLAKKSKVLGKYYVKVGQKVFQGDFPMKKRSIVIPVDAYPDEVSVYMIDRDSSEKIDWNTYWSRDMALEKGVQVDIPAADVEGLIRRGEDQFVEFKSIFTAGKPKEFHETISAFANTKGGVVLMGVDDNGGIIGIDDEGLEDRILESVNNNIVPIPSVSFKRKTLRDKDIVVVRVESGSNPPYMVDEGCEK
ncbi:MAG: helix-turn-helix domain-containing protein [Thermoplasmata archaeon]